MNIENLIKKLGKDTVLNELIQYLPSDTIDEFVSETERLYDLDYYGNVENSI